MPSKIQGIEGRPVALSPGATVRRGAEHPSGKAEVSGQGVDVQITDTARSLATLSQGLAEAPVVDEGRVAAVQEALRDGRYAVDPQRVADRLLRLEHELGTLAVGN